MMAFYVAMHRQFEATWRQINLGLIDGSTLSKFGNDAPNFSGTITDNQRLLWPEIKKWMSPDYAEFIEANATKAEPPPVGDSAS